MNDRIRLLQSFRLLLALLLTCALAPATKAQVRGVINDLSPNRLAAATADDDPTPPADVPVLYLANDDWLAGGAAAAGTPDKLGWQSPDFTGPFEFDLNAVSRVRFSTEVTPGWREHEYRLELAGGDVLYGGLLSVNETNLLFRSSLAGELRIKRAAVRCLERCKANPLVYLGPNGLADWQMLGEANAWREEEGQLITDKDGATLYRPIELPAKALVDFELSSLFPPVFRLSLGVTDGEVVRRDGFRLEVVDFDVIAVYEAGEDIDVARVMTLTPGVERDSLRLRVLLDQPRRRADVFSGEGLPLASVQVKAENPRVLPGVTLEHKRGGLRFESLRVWNWSGPPPQSLTIDRPQAHRIDGTVIDSPLAGYDETQRQFKFDTAAGPVVCPADEMARIYFGEPEKPDARPLRVAGKDGTLLSGWFAGINSERLSLECLSIDTPPLETPTMPIAGLAAIAFNYEPGEEIPNRSLLLRWKGGRMHGCLSPGKAEAGASAVCWLPAGAVRPAPLRENASAQIVSQSLAQFGSMRAAAAATEARVLRRALLNDARQAAVGGGSPERPAGPSRNDTIYLARGDLFRCEITAIDDKCVHCRTASAEKRLAHTDIKAIDLANSADSVYAGRLTFGRLRQEREAARLAAPNTNVGRPGPNTGAASLDNEKFARLLTLPRLLRDDPPMHILCAVNGDCLRGRLLSMTAGKLRFMVGENEREFQRERIAAIVWLHPAGAEAELGAGDAPPRPVNLVYAVCTDKTRLTFVLKQVDEHVLAGTSEILGDCQLPLDRLSELWLGETVNQAAEQTAYHDWTLTPAPEPKAFQAAPDAPEGTDSPLVGQAAPDFELPTAGGGKFQLSQYRGRVVVLDFWASWCAPCIKSLPMLAQLVKELEGDTVELVTVNLRETPEEAQAALARMGLTSRAVLDRDGAVAARYGAAAIPHTVVIGRDGKVMRVFSGTSAGTEKQLRAILSPPAEETP